MPSENPGGRVRLSILAREQPRARASAFCLCLLRHSEAKAEGKGTGTGLDPPDTLLYGCITDGIFSDFLSSIQGAATF